MKNKFVIVFISAFILTNGFVWFGSRNVLLLIVLDLIFVGTFLTRKRIEGILEVFYKNRELIVDLVKNDFKMRFSGSILGTLWAYIHPVITLLVYWFVFQVGLRNGDVQGVPFVMWFVAGLIPWFYFSEAWSGSTSCLLDYSYLVKKVLFDIDIIPSIRLFASFIVHLFFIGLMFVIYILNGYYPTIYWIQLIYYAICLAVITTGLSYITSSLIVFFRDLSQIVSVILEVGMWLTPIMWQDSMLPDYIRPIFMMNPLYYIVKGYRNCMIFNKWFWEEPLYTCYFWIASALLLVIGFKVFDKMRDHFADVM